MAMTAMLRKRIRGRAGKVYPSGYVVKVREVGKRYELRSWTGTIIRTLGPSKFRRYTSNHKETNDAR